MPRRLKDETDLKKESAKLVNRLKKLVDVHTLRLLAKVEKGDITRAGFWRRLLKDYEGLTIAAKQSFERGIHDYAFKVADIEISKLTAYLSDFEKVRIDANGNTRKLPDKILDLKNYDKLTNNAVHRCVRDFDKAIEGGKKGFEKLVRITQTNLIHDPSLTKKIGRGLPRKDIYKIKKDIMDVIGKREFVTTTNVITGKKRTFKTDYYAELVARTRGRELQTQTSLQGFRDNGVDLIRISDHDTVSKICIPFEDNIYSISGKSSRYPKATKYPPFHPNCLHVITPYISYDNEEEVIVSKAS